MCGLSSGVRTCGLQVRQGILSHVVAAMVKLVCSWRVLMIVNQQEKILLCRCEIGLVLWKEQLGGELASVTGLDPEPKQ
jgi:hypothetical protein